MPGPVDHAAGAARPGAAPAACQRCGGTPARYSVTAERGPAVVDWYFARLCLICARGVLSEVDNLGPYVEPTRVSFTSLDTL